MANTIDVFVIVDLAVSHLSNGIKQFLDVSDNEYDIVISIFSPFIIHHSPFIIHHPSFIIPIHFIYT